MIVTQRQQVASCTTMCAQRAPAACSVPALCSTTSTAITRSPSSGISRPGGASNGKERTLAGLSFPAVRQHYCRGFRPHPPDGLWDFRLFLKLRNNAVQPALKSSFIRQARVVFRQANCKSRITWLISVLVPRVSRLRSAANAALRFLFGLFPGFIGVNNAGNDRMAHHVFAAEEVKVDFVDFSQHFNGSDVSRIWVLRSRSICVTSPVITAFELKPIRVRNIFICSIGCSGFHPE